MKITDEQLRACGDRCLAEVNKIRQNLLIGRASLEYWAPILLAEPSDEEIADSSKDLGDGWDSDDYRRIQRMFANRLRSLLEKDDPAVKSVKALMQAEMQSINGAMPTVCFTNETYAEIVAAVRESDAARKNSDA